MIVAILVLFMVLSTVMGIEMPVTQPHAHHICVFFYVWYRAEDKAHWDDSIYTPVIDVPAIGFYTSGDDKVIRWQLEEIARAGIDCLFVSWWGPEDYSDEVAKKVFSYLRSYGLRAAILVEPFLGQNPFRYDKKFWKQVTEYIECEYILRYRDSYLELDGKPLILAFAPIGIVYRPNVSDLAIRIVGTGVVLALFADWGLWPWYLAPCTDSSCLKKLRLIIRRDGYVAIAPRFDDRLLCRLGARRGCDSRLLDPSYSLRIYEYEWKLILENLDKIRIVAIYSWNEYHERSEIELHRDATAYSSASDPYNITRAYVFDALSLLGHYARSILGNFEEQRR